MISLVEPYLRPLPANADVRESFTMRKRMLSDDQRDALEFLFALNPKNRHTTLRMSSSSGKTKVILFYYEWLKSQSQKVSVISYNKKRKYELYASRLDVRGYRKEDFIGKKVSVRSVDVIVLDQSGFCKRTLRSNRDRVDTILSFSDNIRVVEVQSDWNDLLAENVFTRKPVLSERCKFQLQPRSLSEGRYLSSRTKSITEVCSELLDDWFVCTKCEGRPLVLTAFESPELKAECELRDVQYIHFRDESALARLESVTKLILVCDTSSAGSGAGIYSIHSELRYLFHRFALPFRLGREVSAAVVVPSENSVDMGFCMSLLFTIDEIKQICDGAEARNPSKIYAGLRHPQILCLRYLMRTVYGVLPDKERWSPAPISLNPTSYFEVERDEVRVQERSITIPFGEDFYFDELFTENARFPSLDSCLTAETQPTLFCGEDLIW